MYNMEIPRIGSMLTTLGVVLLFCLFKENDFLE
jgi:hypothetical protein